MALESLALAKSYFGAEDHKCRQFENYPECQNKDGYECHKFTCRYYRLQLYRLKAEQKINSKGQGDKITEGGAGIKQEAGKQQIPVDG